MKSKLVYLSILIIIALSIIVILLPYNINPLIIIYIFLMPVISYLIYAITDNKIRKNYYAKVKAILDDLDEKYLLTELLPNGTFEDAKILKEILIDTNKSMIENVNKYKFEMADYKEYIEMWIHEIKLPVATTKLIIENNRNETTNSIEEETNKIEDYIEQVLYYARSSSVEKDYLIDKTSLKDIVNAVIRKNKTQIVYNNIEINLHDLNMYVYTDSKWCMFIINQIVQNSIKYLKDDNKQIEIYGEEAKESTSLYIRDNGIGIDGKDIEKVFEKGFTGANGRIIGKKSTGIGLYLCKKLCKKLGISIALKSNLNEGTIVKVTFPINSYNSFRK